MVPKTPSLSEEIMAEILLKLPIKQILQCKILSKQYYSLIHSPFFFGRHLELTRQTENNDKAIVSPITTSARLFDRKSYAGEFEILPQGNHTAPNFQGHNLVCGPVDGLYCVVQQDNVFVKRSVTVWNPITTEHFVLPSLPLFYDQSQESWVTELLSNNVRFQKCVAFGLGFDQRTRDYKVVIICRFVPCWSGEAKLDISETKSLYVFNITEGEWRNHDGLGVDPSKIESCIGIFFHGACHWIYAPLSGYTILALDMSDESSRQISFPNVEDEIECYDMLIVVINECLALVDGHGGESAGSSSSFDVWVMAEYGVAESWSILFRVSPVPTISGKFLGILGNHFYLFDGKSRMRSYSLDGKGGRRYNVTDVDIHGLLSYEESLVRINRSNLLA